MKRFIVFLSVIVLLISSMNIAGASELVYKKFHVGDEVQWRFQYLVDRCGLECLLTFEAESGMVLNSVSHKQNTNGTSDYGFCQLNSEFHSPFLFGYDYKMRKKHWNKVKDLRYIVAKLEKKPKGTYKYEGMVKGLEGWKHELDLAQAYMVEISTLTKEFLDAQKQLDYCIDVFKDAKKKKKIRTTWYAFAHINTRPGVRDRFYTESKK